MNLKNPT